VSRIPAGEPGGLTGPGSCTVAEGWTIDPEDLAAPSPTITERIKRFGECVIDGLSDPPEAFDRDR
jgi:hypothetical protein